MNKYLVTGANGRIGRSLCATLVALGHEIIAIERHGIIPHSDIKNDSITWFECDLRERTGIESLATQLREQNIMLDGLVHSAAIVGDSNLSGFVTNLEELSEEACLATFNINTLSFIWLLSSLSSQNVFSHNAAVVAINSIYGSVSPDFSIYSGTQMQNPIAYAASKFALHGAIGWLSKYYKDNLRINSVSPGGIESENMPEVFKEHYCSKTLSGKLLQVSDIIPSIAFLLSDSSSAVYGQNIIVDGGFCV